MNRTDFQDLADLRVAEAECLFRNGMFDGAYYLAGYAVEAGLKACIAKLTKPHDFPPEVFSTRLLHSRPGSPPEDGQP